MQLIILRVVRREGPRCDPPRREGRLVPDCYTRIASAIQAPVQAWSSHDCRQAVRRDGSRNAKQCTEASRTQGAEMMRYAVVIEKADDNYSAYVPDLPGCVATGSTIPEVEAEIRDAIRFHIDGLKADGLAVPAPTTIAEYVDA